MFKQLSTLSKHVNRKHCGESREENCLKSPEVECFDVNASSNAINGSSSVDNESIEASVGHKEELHDNSDCEQIFHKDERLSIDATMSKLIWLIVQYIFLISLSCSYGIINAPYSKLPAFIITYVYPYCADGCWKNKN